jgi:hypothetical protein
MRERLVKKGKDKAFKAIDAAMDKLDSVMDSMFKGDEEPELTATSVIRVRITRTQLMSLLTAEKKELNFKAGGNLMIHIEVA